MKRDPLPASSRVARRRRTVRSSLRVRGRSAAFARTLEALHRTGRLRFPTAKRRAPHWEATHLPVFKKGDRTAWGVIQSLNYSGGLYNHSAGYSYYVRDKRGVLHNVAEATLLHRMQRSRA